MKRLITLSLSLLAAACSVGDGGPLIPEKGDASTDGTVAVENGGLTASIRAQWASEGSQAVQLRYRNEGREPASIHLGHLRLHHRLGNAGLWSVSDMTRVNRDDTRTDNDVPPIVFDGSPGREAPIITIPSGGERFFAIGFTNFPGDERITQGDDVSLVLPMGRNDVTLRLSAR